MVMVVANACFEASRRSRGLNPAEESFGHQPSQRVVHRLLGDDADFCPNRIGNGVRSDVRLRPHRPQDSQSLGGDLNAALPKEFSRVDGQAVMLDQIIE